MTGTSRRVYGVPSAATALMSASRFDPEAAEEPAMTDLKSLSGYSG